MSHINKEVFNSRTDKIHFPLLMFKALSTGVI